MQRELAAQLAAQVGMEVISFRHFDCVLFSRTSILKMFRPQSDRVMLGGPGDRKVSGNLFLVHEEDLMPLRPPSKRFEYRKEIYSVHIANFSNLTLYSGIDEGRVDPAFLEGVARLLKALPDDRADWKDRFGEDYFSISQNMTSSEVLNFLRDTVTFEPPSWLDHRFPDSRFKVTFELPLV